MDHRRVETAQTYYRVTSQRRREAVDRVTTMQIDRHGNRIWRQAQILLDAEYARRAIGEVQVPYGLCTEPSNVAASGHDCPVRFRCVGCGRVRTDVSYLPDPERVLKALDAMLRGDGDITVSGLTRAARVDRTFLYQHRDLLQRIHSAASTPREVGRIAAVSRASLQADLASTLERNQRLAARVRQLEKRLSHTFGEAAWNESGLGAPADGTPATSRADSALRVRHDTTRGLPAPADSRRQTHRPGITRSSSAAAARPGGRSPLCPAPSSLPTPARPSLSMRPATSWPRRTSPRSRSSAPATTT
uniref:Transposase n=1 Tax=Streptomyces auratus AGR0001 TaxID=1160718 RepID=J2JQE4_9ACTN